MNYLMNYLLVSSIFELIPAKKTYKIYRIYLNLIYNF